MLEKFENYFSNQDIFDNVQENIFEDQLGKSIFINKGLALGNINAAFVQPEILLPVSNDRDYNIYLENDPTNTYVDIDLSMCKQAKYPLDMPAIDVSKGTGCGWYYVDDPHQPSVGAVGSFHGPLFKDSLPANGQWIWNRVTAAMKEDIKFCKNIKSCKALSIDEVKRKCGFCPEHNNMIPVTGGGSIKYPDTVDGGCGVPIITSLPDCETPAPIVPVTTTDNKPCGKLGYPSPDNSMRLYNKDDCDKLDGNLSFRNECLNKNGGSYSWDCKSLNPAIVQNTIPSLCTPNAQGVLSRECLISLAKSIGYYDSGAIVRILKTPSIPFTDVDNQSFEALKKNDITVPDTILGRGNSDDKTALKMYYDLYQNVNNPIKLVSKAANWLVFGITPDLCDVDSNDKGPFSVDCLQRGFRMSGCQASGKAYPSYNTMKQYNGMSWSSIMASFQLLFDTMQSTDKGAADLATKQCLGIEFFRPGDNDSFKYNPGKSVDRETRKNATIRNYPAAGSQEDVTVQCEQVFFRTEKLRGLKFSLE